LPEHYWLLKVLSVNPSWNEQRGLFDEGARA
jgi:hypothetical protein